MPRRIARWKVVAGAAGLAGTLLGAFVLWCADAGERRWEAMRRRVEAARPPVPVDRPPLRGDAAPGDAWQAYAEISFGEVRWYTPEWRAVSQVHSGDSGGISSIHFVDPGVAWPTARAAVELRRGALDALQTGARRRPGPPPPEPAPAEALEVVAGCRARLLAADGREREAVDLLLDLAVYARDFAWVASGHLRGRAVSQLETALDGLGNLITCCGLTRDDFLRVDRDLEALDRLLPDAAWLPTSDVLSLGQEFLRSNDLFTDLRRPRCLCLEHVCPAWGAWRYGFSDRLMAANAFYEALGVAAQAEAVQAGSWAERNRRKDDLSAGLERSGNPIVRSHVAPMASMDVFLREARARLALLRVAARFRATGEVLDLPDPFGGRLRGSRTGDRLKAWSAGRDGIDDGGAGAWKGGAHKDLVLELDR